MTNVTYRLDLAPHAAYLHATVTGERTPKNLLRYFEEVHEAAVEGKHSALLLDVRLAGPSLDAVSLFQVVTQRSGPGSMFRRIAYVESGLAQPGREGFAVDTAVNRGVNVRMFEDVEAAARWLTDRGD